MNSQVDNTAKSLQLEAEVVAGGVDQILFQPQIPLRGLHGGVPERKLDLLERGVALVRQLGERPPQGCRAGPNRFVTARRR